MLLPLIIKFNIEKIMKKIVKKWEGGAKKHGGFGKAMGVQIDKWIQSPEEQAKEIREAEELRQRLENERLAKESAAEREKLVQEQSRQVVEVSKKHAEELEQVVLAKKLSKESFKKSQIEKIGDFLSRSEDVSDEAAFPAMDIVKNWTSTYAELIEKLHGFGDEALDKFLSSVEIAGDSSF
jgi:hypothetical protein